MASSAPLCCIATARSSLRRSNGASGVTARHPAPTPPSAALAAALAPSMEPNTVTTALSAL